MNKNWPLGEYDMEVEPDGDASEFISRDEHLRRTEELEQAQNSRNSDPLLLSLMHAFSEMVMPLKRLFRMIFGT